MMSFPATVLFAAVAASPFWGDLEPGPHRVGFEERELVDHSRPYRAAGEDRARAITVYVWYPAADDAEAPGGLPLSRYVTGAAGGRERFETLLRLYGSPLVEEELTRLLRTPTSAHESAPPAPGRHPLLIAGGGLAAPVYLNSLLGEYLASYGYIVVALPTVAASEARAPDYDHRTVDAQMRDMELVIQEMHGDGQADISRIGLIGWSLAGVSQALLQMKNPDVAAVVSLDAATGYDYGRELLETSIFFDPESARAPFFHATDSRADTSPAKKSFRYYDEIVSGRGYLLTLDGMRHPDFTSLGSVFPRPRLEGGADGGASATATRYELLCVYVRHFLAEALSNDPAATEFLSVAPTRHGFEGLVLSRKR